MSVAHTVTLSDELFQEVSQQADPTGMSPQDWVSHILCERIRAERRSVGFFRMRSAGASSLPLGKLLDKAPEVPPDTGDEFLV